MTEPRKSLVRHQSLRSRMCVCAYVLVAHARAYGWISVRSRREQVIMKNE